MATAPLVWGTWNTHVSLALHSGGLNWLLRAAPGVHGWSLQEVVDVKHLKAALHRAGAIDDWYVLPASGYERRGALPYVMIRRTPRFEIVSFKSPPIVPASHPRALAQAVFWDNATKREIHTSSVHVDPLGRGFIHANPRARLRHERQVQKYADALAEAPASAVALASGDWNEQLATVPYGRLSSRSARGRMAAVGAAPGFRLTQRGNRHVRLDDVFVRVAPHVDVTHRRMLDPPVRGNDHAAVVLRMRVSVK